MTGVRMWLRRPLFVLGWSLAVLLAAPSVAAGATDLGPVGFGSIVVDDVHQHVFVSEPDANAIVELDYQGGVISTMAGLGAPWGMTIVGDYLYVAEDNSGTVARIDLTRQPLTPQTLATGLVRPLWLTAAAGKLWTTVGETDPYRLVSIDPSSGQVSQPYAAYTNPDLASSPGDPNSLYVGEDFVSGGGIYRLDATQSPPAELATYPPNDYDNIQEIVVSPDGSRVIPAAGAPYYLEEMCAATLKPDGIHYAFDSYPFADAVSASGLLAGGLNGFVTPNVYVWKLGVPNAFFTATAIGSQGVFAHGVALTADGTRVFAVSQDASSSSSGNTRGNTIVNVFNVPAPPSTAPTNPCPAVGGGGGSVSNGGGSGSGGSTGGGGGPGTTGGSSGAARSAGATGTSSGSRMVPSLKGSLKVRLKRNSRRPAAGFLLTVRLQALPRGAASPTRYRFAIALTGLRCASGATGLRISIGSRHLVIACRARAGRITGSVSAASSYLIRVVLLPRGASRGHPLKGQMYALGLETTTR